jgi:hypothetical protein
MHNPKPKNEDFALEIAPKPAGGQAVTSLQLYNA